jgi:ABC-type Mn2+/Zn2+ transport system permease subunit
MAYAIGLAGSALLDLPSGPLIVWMLALCGTISATVTKHNPIILSE